MQICSHIADYSCTKVVRDGTLHLGTIRFVFCFLLCKISKPAHSVLFCSYGKTPPDHTAKTHRLKNSRIHLLLV